MPNWKFLVARHFGGGQQRRLTCASIKQLVEERGLAHVLPLVKYEVGRGREYYIGVAVDAQDRAGDDSVTETARQILHNAGIHSATNPQMSWILEPDAVQGLLRGNLECESFTIPIAYESAEDLRVPAVGQLLAELERDELHSSEPSREDTERQLRMLHWCSAVGSGDLARLQQVCRLLNITTEWGGAWSVLRRFVLLGHLEFDGGAALRWGAVPPTIVQTMLDEECGFLVGQRSPKIVDALREHFTIEELAQAGGPSRLLLRGGNISADIDAMPGIRVACVGRAAQRLGKLLPNLTEWKTRLPTWDEQDFGRFGVERYVPEADEIHTCAFSEASASGLFRFTLEQPGRALTTVAYRHEIGGRWICGDYYGLRFLARSSRGLCRAAYRSEQRQLVIPMADRWPMPYERALVLAGGLLPQRMMTEGGRSLLVYDAVPRDFAEAMCSLVGLTPECE